MPEAKSGAVDSSSSPAPDPESTGAAENFYGNQVPVPDPGGNGAQEVVVDYFPDDTAVTAEKPKGDGLFGKRSGNR